MANNKSTTAPVSNSPQEEPILPDEAENKTELEVPETEGDTVSVDKITLQNILTRLQELEAKKDQKRKNYSNKHFAKVRYGGPNQDEIVVGYGRTWEKSELGQPRYLVIEVITDVKGKKNTYVEKYTEFMELGKYEMAEIVSIKKQPVEKEIGWVNKVKIDYANYKSEETDEQVPLVVSSIHATYSLKLNDGSTIALPEEALN